MDCIKIEKSYRNGITTKFMIIEDGDSLQDIVEEWCEKDPSGHSYGYSYSCEKVKDSEIIKKTLSEEISALNKEMKLLTAKHDKLMRSLIEHIRNEQA